MVTADVASHETSWPPGGSAEAFGGVVDPYRRELLVHCYRMLGSIDDAEDALQDALANAWHRRNTFQRDVSFRAWLYRIATNACIDAIGSRKRRRGSEVHIGVGPFPDELLDEATVAGPEARFDAHESISLAFLTALQLLPPRQRAVLVLRDVLSWRAAEVARLLDLSVPAVNSALQRARATVSRRYGQPGRSGPRVAPAPQHGGLLERYVRAWESADVAGLVALLREDALLTMPPRPSVAGAGAIGEFLAASMLDATRPMRLLATRANGSPAFLAYANPGRGERFDAFALMVLTHDGHLVAQIDAFADPDVLGRFGPPCLPC
jgi:RNA polymerase sigma-70 factor (ECF subfamily)